MFANGAGNQRRGFTLIELLIVIVVISILALIIVPKIITSARQSRDAVLRDNLHRLRLALSKFQADTGVYPASIEQLILPKVTPPAAGAGGATIPAILYDGPYFQSGGGIAGSGLPENPYAVGDAEITNHWSYDTTSALNPSVSPATPAGQTLDGVDYADL